MSAGEFQRVRFGSEAQWRAGLLVGLTADKNGSLSLTDLPVVACRIVDARQAAGLIDLVAGDCGQLAWLARDRSSELLTLEAWEPGIDRARLRTGLEVALGDDECLRLARGAERLWLLDPARRRLVAMLEDSLQIVAERAVSAEAIDMAADDTGKVALLDREALWLIGRFDERRHVHDRAFGDPLAVTLTPDGQTALLTATCRNGFVRVDPASGECSSFADFDADVRDGYRPDRIVAGRAAVYALRRGEHRVEVFDFSGAHLGSVEVGAPVRALALSPDNTLYLAGAGIAATAPGLRAGQRGTFVTPTLDSGEDPQDLWHRVDLSTTLPSGTVVEGRYALLPESMVEDRRAIDEILAGDAPATVKLRRIDARLAGHWSPPELIGSPSATLEPPDGGGRRPVRGFLLRGATGDESDVEAPQATTAPQPGRYLWVRLELKSFDPAARPVLHRLDVVRPRLSFLRYLPAVYQEDETSRRLLERFLSAFETVFQGIDDEIERLPEYFRAGGAPADFLPWLAGWLDLAIEERWSVAIRRELIRRAAALFRMRGTPRVAAELLEILTGRRPRIVEHGMESFPLVLGVAGRIGTGTTLMPAPLRRGVRLGKPLEGRLLDADDGDLASAIRHRAYRFTVVLPMSAAAYRLNAQGIRRIIDDAFPAASRVAVRVVPDSRLGGATEIGPGFRLTGTHVLRLDGDSTLGASVLAARRRLGSALGAGAASVGQLRLI